MALLRRSVDADVGRRQRADRLRPRRVKALYKAEAGRRPGDPPPYEVIVSAAGAARRAADQPAAQRPGRRQGLRHGDGSGHDPGVLRRRLGAQAGRAQGRRSRATARSRSRSRSPASGRVRRRPISSSPSSRRRRSPCGNQGRLVTVPVRSQAAIVASSRAVADAQLRPAVGRTQTTSATAQIYGRRTADASGCMVDSASDEPRPTRATGQSPQLRRHERLRGFAGRPVTINATVD